mgnify:CR=1 FL=1
MTLYTAERLVDSLRAAPALRTAALPPHRKPTITTGTVTLGRSERR